MKIVLNAAGVKALVEHDPEGTVELAKGAASQVAHQLAGLITEQKVAARVANVIDGMVNTGSSYRTIISHTATTMIQQAIKDRLDIEIDMREGSARHRAITDLIRAYMTKSEDQFLASLEAKIDALIMKRFAAIFSQKTTEG